MVKSEVMTEFPTDYHSKPRPSNPRRRPHREKLDTAPFVAWDGEGYTDDNGDHHYMLFGNSRGEYVEGESLTWQECLPLLLKPDGHSGINVIYGGTYDIVMMFKTLPYGKLARLHAGKPVRYGGYRVQWFKRKFLRLTDLNTHYSTTLYDVISFFQTSFVNACKQYLGDDETLQDMYAMKLKRDSFAMGDPAVIPYWQSELNYLVKLMERLRTLLSAVDIKPTSGWFGPGPIASALLTQHGMKRYYKRKIPKRVIDVAERAYYGGRFEQFKIGRIDHLHEYDIRSAYPAAIAQLPDFASAKWDRVKNPTEISEHGLYCVSWSVKGAFGACPLPWRREDGRIYYPYQGHKSWYWGIELQHLKGITVHEGYVPTFPTNDRPFTWVTEMYNDRARMKADGNPAQMALKLGLNSLYGKLAQSTGANLDKHGRWVKPPWHYILWAGWVTAHTRAKIYRAIQAAEPHTLIAVETDAVFTTEPWDMDIGTELGQWEHSEIKQILYVRSGQYYAMTDDGLWRVKSRGVEIDKSRTARDWFADFKRLPFFDVKITQTIRRFGTDIRNEHYGKWHDLEISTTMPKCPTRTPYKRAHHPARCFTCMKYGHAAKLVVDQGRNDYEDFSYADKAHQLIVPQALIESDMVSSTPYKFPWRDDGADEWELRDSDEYIMERI